MGFNREKLLDVAIFPTSVSFLFFSLAGDLAGFRFPLTCLIFFLVFSRLSARQGWSYQRICDIAAESTALGLIFFPFPMVVWNLLFLALFLVFRRLSAHNPRGGLVTYSFFIFFSVSYVLGNVLESVFLTVPNFFMLALMIVSLLRLKKGGYFGEILRLTKVIIRLRASAKPENQPLFTKTDPKGN